MDLIMNLGDLSRSFRRRPSRPDRQMLGLEDLRREEDAPRREEDASAPASEVPRSSDHAAPVEDGQGDQLDEAKPRWIGYIDRVDGKYIHGWAYDNLDPDSSVTIQVILPDKRELFVVADLLREDVKEAGYGNGHHGFQIGYEDLKANEGEVQVVFYETKELLVGGTLMLDPRKALLNSTMPSGYSQAMKLLAAQARASHAALKLAPPAD